MCLDDNTHVDDYEFSSTIDLVQFSVATVSVVPMSVSFDVTKPIVDTIGMSTYGSPIATSFLMNDDDDQHSNPIYFIWTDTRKKTFHESSTEFLSSASLTSSTQVLNARLQGLVLMMLVCNWFNFHKDITYYFNWDPGGGWSSLCYLIACGQEISRRADFNDPIFWPSRSPKSKWRIRIN